MRISTVIPMYNAEKYIARTLKSLLNQDKSRNVEIIIIDDGSTDQSAMICDRFKKEYSNIRIYHIENHGVSYARNYGLKKATGDYIHFLDADDVIDSKMYESFFEVANKYAPDIIMCGCRIQNIHNKNDFQIKCIEESKFFRTKKEYSDYIKNIDFREDTWMFDYIWNKWYKAEKLRQSKVRFDESIHISEDFAFNCDFFCDISNAYIMKDILYTYIWHGEGLVTAFHHQPWKNREVVYKKEKNMENILKIEDFGVKIEKNEGFYAFAAIKSVNNPKCYYNRKERKQFISEFIKSWQYGILIKYLKRKNSLGKCLSIIIGIWPKSSLKILIQIDKLKRNLKNWRK